MTNSDKQDSKYTLTIAKKKKRIACYQTHCNQLMNINFINQRNQQNKKLFFEFKYECGIIIEFRHSNIAI